MERWRQSDCCFGGACLLVDSLLCFVFVSKKLDPLSRHLKMSWRGKPPQRPGNGRRQGQKSFR